MTICHTVWTGATPGSLGSMRSSSPAPPRRRTTYGDPRLDRDPGGNPDGPALPFWPSRSADVTNQTGDSESFALFSKGPVERRGPCVISRQTLESRNVGKTRARGATKWMVMVSVFVPLLGCDTQITDPDAARLFRQSVGSLTITVFPAFVRKGAMHFSEPKAADSVAAAFRSLHLGEAAVSTDTVTLHGTWHMNQARMMRESAAEFAANVAAHPPSTGYALLPEYLLSGDPAREAIGIHCYVVDSAGKIVFIVLLNSHWDEFKAVNPHTVDACTEVLEKTVEDRLAKRQKASG